MKANSVQVNNFQQGMNMDTDVSMLTSQQYRYAENVRILTNDKGTSGTLQTIEGVKSYNLLIDDNETILATTTVDKYGIVLTKINNTAINKLYRIDRFNTNTPNVVIVLQGELYIGCRPESSNVSMVANYETDQNIKVYFTDGASQVKCINIMDDRYVPSQGNTLLDDNGYIKNVYAIDITPGSVLPPLQITSLGNGSLSTGVVQYCYQLFNTHGSETTTSSLSNSVHLSSSVTSVNSYRYEGSTPDSSSNKSCVLSAPLITHDFDKCRIIRIFYKSNNSIPAIDIIDEFDLSKNQNYIYYTDNGNYAIGSITIDEFNALTSYQFIGKTLAKTNNRLFVANITEDTWNPDYDARSFRANKSGQVRLESAANNSIVFNIGDPLFGTGENGDPLLLIDKAHDCINPYNTLKSPEITDSNKYAYGYRKTSSGTVYYPVGGRGKNIDFEIVDTSVNLSSDVTTDYPSSSIVEYTAPEKIGSMFVSDCEGYQSLVSIPEETRQINYADPFIASRFRAYAHDEVYRFGIIFYNSKNVPSPVKWIADIRFPHSAETYTNASGVTSYRWAPFEFTTKKNGATLRNASGTAYKCLQGKPLGVKFYIKSVPAGAKAYEIVRCDRTEADRTVVMQVAASLVFNNLNQTTKGEVGSENGSLTDLRPPSYITYAKQLLACATNSADLQFVPSATVPDSYLNLTSPEICTMKESIEPFFDNAYIDPLYGIGSYLGADGSSTWSGITKNLYRIFAVPGQYKNTENKYYSYDAGSLQTKVGDVLYTSVDWYNRGTGIFNYIKGETLTGWWLQRFHKNDGQNHASAMIGKYYIPFFTQDYGSRQSQISIYGSSAYKSIDIQYAKYGADVPYNVEVFEENKFNYLPYYVNVGDTVFLNVASNRTVTTTGGSHNWTAGKFEWTYDKLNIGDEYGTFGPHGPSVVIKAEGIRQQVPYFRSKIINSISSSDAGTVASALMCSIKRSIKQYGGDTYSARSGSVYIPTGNYTVIDKISTYTEYVFGGDVYLGVLDYPSQMIFQYKKDGDANVLKTFFGNYIPFESSINVSLLHGDMVHKTVTGTGNSSTLDAYMQIEPVQMGIYHTQDRPYFAYNNVYSSQNGSKSFVPESIYNENNVTTSNRIYASEQKTNNEIFDNWTSFKVANYLDVDNKFGGITNLYSFLDRLYFFQPESVGIASVNDRSLISDNLGQLTLGTGDVLSRYDYISNKNGSSIVNDRSLCSTDTSIYWYDYDKNVLCCYSDSIHQLSREKYVQSYLNELYTSKRNEVVSFYDNKYNEVWFKFQKKSLIYNEQLGAFTSLYTHTPDFILRFSDKIVSIRNNQFYVINSLDTDTLGDVDKISKIQFVVNNEYPNNKVFDNVLITGDLMDQLNRENPTVLVKAEFETKNQKSQVFDNTTNKIDYREDTYRFAIPREDRSIDGSTDIANMSFAGRMRGKYLICTYTFDNTSESVFNIPSITTTYRFSLI